MSDYTGGLQEGGPIRVENALSVTSHPEIRPPWVWVGVRWADFGHAANAGMGIGAARIERPRVLDVRVRSASDR